MYHSVGGVLATGAVLVGGGSIVVREKFSATRFWTDVVRWDCTIFQYIGELCRYLLHTPRHPFESQHRLRMCCGNGLRLDVWTEFQNRFHVPQILEFYAATEGNVSLFNVEGKAGAIGRIPPFLAHRFPAAMVRLDVETGEPIRDEHGRCVRSAPNEAGETIGPLLGSKSNVGNWCEGYTDGNATEEKILRDVFEPGDAWFRTGDLMRKDEKGFFYFVDRIGDTFRWKGENVATSEVSDAMCGFPGIKEAIVYGVPVPGAEGRAGMAALVVEGDLDLDALRDHLSRCLPAYACPLVLRIRQALSVTGTFKYAKHELASDGYDPCTIADPLYFNARDAGAYVRLDKALYDRIQSGQVRV
jgi:fatty-acyl-CoA synthase